MARSKKILKMIAKQARNLDGFAETLKVNSEIQCIRAWECFTHCPASRRNAAWYKLSST